MKNQSTHRLYIKAEFDSALSDFNARLTTFEAGINSKIDSQVSSYLDRNGIWNGKTQVVTLTGNFEFVDTAIYSTPQLLVGNQYNITNKKEVFTANKSGMLRLKLKYGTTSCLVGYTVNKDQNTSNKYEYNGMPHAVILLSPKNTESDAYADQNPIWMYDIQGTTDLWSFSESPTGETNKFYSTSSKVKEAWTGDVNEVITADHYLGGRLSFPVGIYEYYTFVNKGTTYCFSFYVYTANGHYTAPNTDWPLASVGIYYIPNNRAPVAQRSVKILGATVY